MMLHDTIAEGGIQRVEKMKEKEMAVCMCYEAWLVYEYDTN